MSEEEKKWNKKDKPTYIMVPRNLIITWLTTTFILFVLVIASFQYTNYVDRRSNGLWCGIISLFDNTYQKSPPPTETGRILAGEFRRISSEFRCS